MYKATDTVSLWSEKVFRLIAKYSLKMNMKTCKYAIQTDFTCTLSTLQVINKYTG